MNDRDKELVKQFGPRFVKRSGDILTSFLHLSADAYSVMTDDEWKECAAAIDNLVPILEKTRTMVRERIREATGKLY